MHSFLHLGLGSVRFFPTRFSGIPPLLTADSDSREERRELQEKRSSPLLPPINFPQFVLFPATIREKRYRYPFLADSSYSSTSNPIDRSIDR